MHKIEPQEISFVKQSADENKLFTWNGDLYRLIVSSDVQNGRWKRLNDFVNSDPFRSLMAKRYVPLMSPTDLVLKGRPGTIYRIEEITHCTEPMEWVAAMRLDALKLVCKINMQLIEEGSEFLANDCNLAQMTFFKGKPIFLDIGGFSDVRNGLAKQNFTQDLNRVLANFKTGPQGWLESFDESSSESWKSGLAFLSSFTVEDIVKSEEKNFWDDYAKVKKTPLSTLLKPTDPEAALLFSWVSRLSGVSSIFDAGASTGRLAFLFAAHGKTVIAADYSARPLTLAYEANKNHELPINFMKIDLVTPYQPSDPPKHNELDDWRRRLRCDLVVASSITHHLSKAGVSLEKQADLLGGIAGRYLLVEFIGYEDKYVGKWDLGDKYNREGFLRPFKEDWTLLNETSEFEVGRTWFLLERKKPLSKGRQWYRFDNPDLQAQ